MKPELKALHSPDVFDLEAWSPAGDFAVFIQIMVGPLGEPGEESFDVMVCSPGALAKELAPGMVKSGRHYLFMERYEYPALRKWIEEKVAEVEGDSWADIACKLSRIGRWEFEDYIPYTGAKK
jgi:hypothetical protein